MTPEQIKRLRRALNESTEAFGSRFGRSGRAVENWEQGRRAPDVLVQREMMRLARRRRIHLDGRSS